MEVPKDLKPDEVSKEKIKSWLNSDGKRIEDVPEEINSFEDATKYLANSIIHVYGYDEKKRIHKVEMTIKEALQNKIRLGGLDILDESPLKHMGLYFNQDLRIDPDEFFSLELKVNFHLSNHNHNYFSKEAQKNVKKAVEREKTRGWELRGLIYTANFLNRPETYTTVKVDTPKEILWVFETFKDFTPSIHGGALRDLYMGIERTADIDIRLNSPKGRWAERKRYKLLKKVMDEVEIVSKGWQEDSYHGGEYHSAHYNARKGGVLYDIAGGVHTRYLSIEQIAMRKPGELMMYNLAKHDLDNKQFRFIHTYKIPERIVQKIGKLRGLGLTFLSENPSNLSKKFEIFLYEENKSRKEKHICGWGDGE